MANNQDKKNKKYLEQHWNLHKFSTLPAEIQLELECAWDDLAQRLNAAMGDVDDTLQRKIPFDAGMDSSRGNLECAFEAFEDVKEAIKLYHEHAIGRQDRDDVEKFVDGEAVNSMETEQ